MPEEKRPVQPDAPGPKDVDDEGNPRRRVSRLAVAAGILAVSSVIMTAARLVDRVDYWKWVYLVDGLATLVAGIAAVSVVRATRWRTAGYLMAWVSIAVGAFALLVEPATCHVRENARRAQCRSNLRQVGLAIHIYADDNGEVFPLSLQQLHPDFVDNPRVFSCPSEPSSYKDFLPGGKVTEKSSSYTLVPGLCAAMPVLILAYESSLENHRKEGRESGRTVLFTDAHVEWWPASREAEFQRTLAAQRAAVEQWRKSGKPVESFGEFYQRPADRKE